MLLTALLESSPDIIVFALDRKYRYLSFNAEHARVIRQIWGVNIRNGMNMLDVFGDHPDKIKAKANMDNALSGNRFTIVEQYGNESLARMYWEDSWAPIYDEHHEIIGLTCVVKNITEQKRSEIGIPQCQRTIEPLFRTLRQRISFYDVGGTDRME